MLALPTRPKPRHSYPPAGVLPSLPDAPSDRRDPAPVGDEERDRLGHPAYRVELDPLVEAVDVVGQRPIDHGRYAGIEAEEARIGGAREDPPFEGTAEGRGVAALEQRLSLGAA